MTKLLITGAEGQLGKDLVRKARERRFEVVGMNRSGLDITREKEVRKVFRAHLPDWVVNAAAYTLVDRAEEEVEKAFAVNALGPEILAEACADMDIPLVHVSTDYVFDGTKVGPYLETDSVRPVNRYGMSKAEGENRIRNVLAGHLIIRTSWLYGVHGGNFVKTMLRLGRERDTLRVVSDQVGSPTWASDLAEAVVDIIALSKADGTVSPGTYHYCGKGETTWHGLASAIFDIAHAISSYPKPRVIPISTSGYPTPAARPANSVLDCHLMENRLGIRRKPWRESLAEVVKILLSD